MSCRERKRWKFPEKRTENGAEDSSTRRRELLVASQIRDIIKYGKKRLEVGVECLLILCVSVVANHRRKSYTATGNR